MNELALSAVCAVFGFLVGALAGRYLGRTRAEAEARKRVTNIVADIENDLHSLERDLLVERVRKPGHSDRSH